MIKLKISKREIKNNFKNVLYCGYCELSDLLNYRNANYYNANSYGWRNDIYLIDNNTVIVTGYEPFGNIEIPKDIAKKYNAIAYRIKKNGLKDAQTQKITFDFDILKDNMDEVIKEMVQEIIK